MERQVHTGKIEHRFLTLQMDSLPDELQGESSLKETMKSMERQVHNGKINLNYVLK